MPTLSALPEFDRLRVVLVATRNPLNIGAAARAMSNFGFLHLRVVNPYEVAFREARSAVGASSVLAAAEEFPTVAEAVADCTLVVGTTAVGSRALRHQLRHLEDGARAIRKRLTSGNVAVLFGSEKRGLSNEDLSHCDWLMRIPTREQHESVNLGQAVAICLYELARSPRSTKGPTSATTRKPATAREPAGSRKPATAADLERITSIMLEALAASDSLQARSAASTREKLRRMLHRHNLTAADAEFWQGMLRQIAWKLQSSKLTPPKL
jgi:TrmH family RNA methyltransferase